MQNKLKNIFAFDGEGPWGKPGSRRPGNGGRQNGPRQNNPQNMDIEDVIRIAQEKFKGFGGGNGGGNMPDSGLSPRMLGYAALAVAGFWLASGFYMVQPDEQGVVLRFGKYVNTTSAGLNYHLPYPIETVIKPKVTRENVTEIGFRSSGRNSNFFRSATTRSSDNVNVMDVNAESLMLTGDENIIDLDFTITWQIDAAKAQDYLFNVANVEATVKNVAESVMREVIGRHPIDDALTDNKIQIQQEAMQDLQTVLDSYRAGVTVLRVELQQVNPPTQVIDAFRDVQAARADAEKAVNEALGYRNDILPRARGQAAQVEQDAEAYKQAKIAQAQGEADRFLSQLKEYRQAPSVTKQRLYLETMQDVVGNSEKIVLPEGVSKGALPYLPLNQIKGAK